MRVLKFLLGIDTPTLPTVKARLRLESLDGRIVPDGVPVTPTDPGVVVTDPGDGTPPAQSVQEFNFDLQIGDWVWVGSRGTQDVYATRAIDGSTWAVFNDPVNETFAAVLIDAPASYHPELGTTAFTPDSTLPSYVWDPNTSTYYTAPAGTTFAAGVTGSIVDGVNLVFLQLVPPAVFPPEQAPPPRPAPVQGGGVQVIRVTPGKTQKIIIATDDGGSIEINPEPTGRVGPITIKITPQEPAARLLPPDLSRPPLDPTKGVLLPPVGPPPPPPSN